MIYFQSKHWGQLFSLCLLLGISLHALANTTLRVSPLALHSQLNQAGLVVIDTRTPTAYKQGHIPGALNFPEHNTYANKNQDGRIVQPAQMQKIIQSLGLTVDQAIVVYDNGELTASARVFWSLEVYGFNHVKVLDQGLEGWKRHHFKLSQTIPQPTPSQYIPVINHNRIATKLKTQIATQSPNQIIIDARPHLAYIGKQSSAKRFGHIPTAINIHAEHNLKQKNALNSLQPLAQLKQLYAHIPHNKKIVIYCAIGRISTTNYLTLRELGYDVSNYDASWKEWGNDFSLPIEK